MEQQTVVSDSIVRKIQNLLNLASRTTNNDGSSNEAEASAAMAKVMDLLAQHNLDLESVQDKVVEGGQAAKEAETKREKQRINRSAMYRWQQNLVKAIAEANFCRYWVQHTTDEKGRGGRTRNVKRHQILGRMVNTAVVLVMVDYLFDTIERLLPFDNREMLSKSAVSWREGCADRLIERIQAKAEEMRTPDYAKQGERAYTTAIQVADLVKKEEAGNYDFMYGEGAWAKKLQRYADWEAGAQQRQVDYERRQKEAEEAETKRLAGMTDKQREAEERRKAKEEEKEERANQRWWNSYYSRQARESERLDHSAYAAGQRIANDISLDSQLGEGAKQRGLK